MVRTWRDLGEDAVGPRTTNTISENGCHSSRRRDIAAQRRSNMLCTDDGGESAVLQLQ